MITSVGTPQTIAAQGLRIECMYPADDAAKLEHLNLMSWTRKAARLPER